MVGSSSDDDDDDDDVRSSGQRPPPKLWERVLVWAMILGGFAGMVHEQLTQMSLSSLSEKKLVEDDWASGSAQEQLAMHWSRCMGLGNPAGVQCVAENCVVNTWSHDGSQETHHLVCDRITKKCTTTHVLTVPRLAQERLTTS